MRIVYVYVDRDGPTLKISGYPSPYKPKNKGQGLRERRPLLKRDFGWDEKRMEGLEITSNGLCSVGCRGESSNDIFFVKKI